MTTYSDNAKRVARGNPSIGCSGKHRFDSQALASSVAHKSNQRKEGDISAYRCAGCGGWHVGGAAIKARQRIARAFKLKRAALIED